MLQPVFDDYEREITAAVGGVKLILPLYPPDRGTLCGDRLEKEGDHWNLYLKKNARSYRESQMMDLWEHHFPDLKLVIIRCVR